MNDYRQSLSPTSRLQNSASYMLSRIACKLRNEMAVPVEVTIVPIQSGSTLEIELDFTNGQPDGFFDYDSSIMYRGQDLIKERLTMHIAALRPTGRFKTLLSGPAGTGKTTLARIIAKKIRGRRFATGCPMGGYYELLGAQVESKLQLDEFMRHLVTDPYAIVFIDEIHTLLNLESFFPVLHDTGSPAYPCSSGERLDIPATISWIGATTDPGQLDSTTGGAMRRRLEPELRLTAPTSAELADVIMDRGIYLEQEVVSTAAHAMAQRSLFPWQARLVHDEASIIARSIGDGPVTDANANDAFRIMELDANGLLREDRDIIAALLMAPYELVTRPGVIRYRMSEEAVCSAAGVDRATYKKRVQPKLLRLGYLTTVGGQSLSDLGVKTYGWLRK